MRYYLIIIQMYLNLARAVLYHGALWLHSLYSPDLDQSMYIYGFGVIGYVYALVQATFRFGYI